VPKSWLLYRGDIRVDTAVIEGLVEYLGLRDEQMRVDDAQQAVSVTGKVTVAGHAEAGKEE
jgi:hypothetical protein